MNTHQEDTSRQTPSHRKPRQPNGPCGGGGISISLYDQLFISELIVTDEIDAMAVKKYTHAHMYK